MPTPPASPAKPASPVLLLLHDGDAFRDLLAARRLSLPGLLQLALFGCLAFAAYGATLAVWRSPLMALCSAAKLPAVFLGSTLLVAACNAAAATLMGTGLSFRDVLSLAFAAMAQAGWILLALAPVALYLSLTAIPDPSAAAHDSLQRIHNAIFVAHFAALAAAGVAGVASLLRGLRRLLPPDRRNRAVPLAAVWIGAYAFVGTQLGWMLRPFVGSPFYPPVFLRPDAFDRNFYEFLFSEVLPFLLFGP